MILDEEKSYIEKIKLIYDLNKHITTLASATIVVFVSFITSFFLQRPPNPNTQWGLIQFVFASLFVSIISAISNMYMCYALMERPGKISGGTLFVFFGVPAILYGVGLFLATLFAWAMFA